MAENANVKAWVEAMRLRTLPVSVSGVLVAVGYALGNDCFRWLPALLCLMFAVLAQIASNFANEYYDYKAGLDKPGRDGFRRGVTEGDIAPEAMKKATYGVLALACCVGLGLVAYGGWWLILAGIAIALGALAYSAGPYPLSHHALGEVAVIVFFGLVPVNLTYYVQSGGFDFGVFVGSLSVGLIGSNILLVNNYRDINDDASAGKRTVAVKFGAAFASLWYLANGYISVALMIPAWLAGSAAWLAVPAVYLLVHTVLWLNIIRRSGSALNPMLGITAMAMAAYCLGFLLSRIC